MPKKSLSFNVRQGGKFFFEGVIQNNVLKFNDLNTEKVYVLGIAPIGYSNVLKKNYINTFPHKDRIFANR